MNTRILNKVIGVIVVVSAFAFTGREITVEDVQGTYGVCDCEGNEAMNFNLTIADDYTFHFYRDNGPAEVIDVKGKWKMDKNTIVLSDYQSDIPIHDKWTVDKNGLCLKSKKGFEWTKLCQVKPCK